MNSRADTALGEREQSVERFRVIVPQNDGLFQSLLQTIEVDQLFRMR
jgi:hypothetical protein